MHVVSVNGLNSPFRLVATVDGLGMIFNTISVHIQTQ